MKHKSTTTKMVPFKMVGGNRFGRYDKVSSEQTFNMIISDGWLVSYAGYKNVLSILMDGSVGRGIFTSSRAGVMIVVVGQNVYVVPRSLIPVLVGNLMTNTGDVFIDENDVHQIGICDKKNIYIYNYSVPSFSVISTGFVPGYIAFQDGRFVAPDLSSSEGGPTWRLSEVGDGTSWPADSAHIGEFQTKPDTPVAAIRFPGSGNNLFVMGSVLTESWFDNGSAPFPYQRSSSFNIDYGCLNPATIAFGENFVVWLGSNEKAGPTLMVSSGGAVEHISTDGIDFKFTTLSNPSNSYGFLFQQDGHWIYQFTFPDDNLSYAYDFKSKEFYTVTDEKMGYHIAKRVCAFNNSYYFVSFNDGNLYELSTKYTNFDYGKEVFEIPRIRVTDTLRLPDNSGFVVSYSTFPIEQGVSELPGKTYLSISNDGGQTFSNFISEDMRPQGIRKSQVNFLNLGYCNEFTQQFRFCGFGRKVVGEGALGIHQ